MTKWPKKNNRCTSIQMTNCQIPLIRFFLNHLFICHCSCCTTAMIIHAGRNEVACFPSISLKSSAERTSGQRWRKYLIILKWKFSLYVILIEMDWHPVQADLSMCPGIGSMTPMTLNRIRSLENEWFILLRYKKKKEYYFLKVLGDCKSKNVILICNKRWLIRWLNSHGTKQYNVLWDFA